MNTAKINSKAVKPEFMFTGRTHGARGGYELNLLS
jgi:hypothetical protein